MAEVPMRAAAMRRSGAMLGVVVAVAVAVAVAMGWLN
jgi:hypothetical protein